MRCSPEGPLDANIVLVGEAPGRTEERLGRPFVGESGKELDRMLLRAGIQRHECYLTNVFLDFPPDGKIENWHLKKREADLHGNANDFFIAQGKYLDPRIAGPERQRLHDELRKIKPNLIVPMGNYACWAVLGQTKISKIRGAVTNSAFGKCLPTIHPAAVLRQWDLRPIVIADLMKANRERQFPEIIRPARTIYIPETLKELRQLFDTFLFRAELVSVDIETPTRQIDCIGFSPSPSISIVVPFVDHSKPNHSYWETLEQELVAWELVKLFLESSTPKVLQNCQYDLYWLWKKMGITCMNMQDDTMLQHHVLFPELQKDLGFLGSIYTDEVAWKLMRHRSDDDLKKDD